MSKFCGNCGTPADDNAMVCGNCGTPFPAAQQPVQPQVQPGYNPATGAPVMNQNIPGVSGNTSKVGGALAFLDSVAGKIGLAPDLFKKILAGVLAVIILILGISAISGGSGYKGVVKDFAKAVETGNGKKLAKKVYTKNDYFDKADIINGFERIHDNICYDFDAKNIKVSYKITDTKKISKSEMNDEWDVNKKGMIVEFELTIKGNGEKETYDAGLYLVKDGGWKIIDMDINY